MAALPPDTPILVVDDSLGIRSVLESYLRRMGYQDVRTAASLEEALAAFREQRPEVVFLDLVLGKESGVDFAADALSERPFTFIVVTTALPRSHDYVTIAVSQGAQEFLQKPIRFTAVREVLERIARAREEAGPESEDVTYA